MVACTPQSTALFHESLLLFTNKTREKKVLVFGFWNIHVASSRFGSFVRSFVLFRFKKSIARNHRTFDFNLVPKILSYPSPTEREGKTEGLGDRTWERGWFDFSSHLPYLFEYASNLELAPTSSKRPSKRQKKVYLPLKKTLNTYFK